jgi:hypothetical protein
LRTSENYSYEYFIDGTFASRLLRTSEKPNSANFALSGFSEVRAESLRRAAVLPILPATLFVFEPVFERRPVGHIVASEGLLVGHGGTF